MRASPKKAAIEEMFRNDKSRDALSVAEAREIIEILFPEAALYMCRWYSSFHYKSFIEAMNGRKRYVANAVVVQAFESLGFRSKPTRARSEGRFFNVSHSHARQCSRIAMKIVNQL